MKITNIAPSVLLVFSTAIHAEILIVKCTEKTSPQITMQSLFGKQLVKKDQLFEAFAEAGLLGFLGPRPTLWKIDSQLKTISAEGFGDLRITLMTSEKIIADFRSVDSSLQQGFSLTRYDGILKLHAIISKSLATEWRAKNGGNLPEFWLWSMECSPAKQVL